MIAQLGMYDWPQLRTAHHQYWTTLRLHLGYGPENLTWDASDYWAIWQSPDLLLSQTCGLPYRANLHQQVNLIGTPDYGLDGCASGEYNSVIVAQTKRPDLQNGILAINDELSQSGWAAPWAHGLRPNRICVTGGHAASAKAVAMGHATLAAIDAQTWTLLIRYTDWARDLQVIERTAPTPALPYITAKSRDVAALQLAIRHAAQTHGSALDIRGIVDIRADDYLALPLPPEPKDVAEIVGVAAD